MKLREFTEADYPRLVELRNLWEPEPIVEDSLRDKDRRFPPDGVLRRMVAESPEGTVVAYAETAHVPHRPKTEWWSTVTVDVPYRRSGLGSRMCADSAEFVRARGGKMMCDYVREDDRAGISFAEKLGARKSEHIYDSVVDPRPFELGPYEPLIEKLRSEGIRFFTFADTSQDEAAKRKLHELYSAAEADMPHALPECRRSYEDFERGFLQAWWWKPEGFWLAADGDQWVGLAAIAIIKDQKAFNEQTGVASGYTGRGIATALKVLSMNWCREQGVTQLRTSNHDGNDAMLAINRKLGYKPEPGWLRYDLHLEDGNG